MAILPDAIEAGEVPSEITGENKKRIQNIIKNKGIKPADRFCALLKQIKAPPGSTGTLFAPNEDDHDKYRKQAILDMVYEIFENRFGTLKIPKPAAISGSNWAVNYSFRPTKIKIITGTQPFKDFSITQQGLRLDLQLDQVKIDLEYDTSPSGSTGNVALCIFTFGGANIVEIQQGNGTATANNVFLSFDLIPSVQGQQIEFELKLSDRSHAKLSYDLKGTNIFTLGAAEIASLIATAFNAFEEDIFEAIGDELKDLGQDFPVSFPGLFTFVDTPKVSLKHAVIDSNPSQSLLLGARLNLPKGTIPAPVEVSGPLTCKRDFAITLSTDYLNGVLYHRLDQYKKKTQSLKLDWKKYLTSQDLPSVTLPSDYQDNPKFPQSFHENHEEWKVSNPYLTLNSLSTTPNLSDPIGTIHMTVTYQLVRTRYGWCGSVKPPLYDWRVNWFDQFGPKPISSWRKPRIPIEDYLTQRYGMYQTAEGDIISRPIAEAELTSPYNRLPNKTRQQKTTLDNDVVPMMNDEPPTPGWKAGKTSVGGVIVDWWSYPLATDEHINVHVDITANAYVALNRKTPSFLPELNLCYDNLQVKVSKFGVSSSLSKLSGMQAMFEKAVKAYIKPFFDQHPFKQNFHHPYTNLAYAFPNCGKTYASPFRKGETPIFVGLIPPVNMSTLISPTNNQQLSLQRDGQKLILHFGFMEGLPT